MILSNKNLCTSKGPHPLKRVESKPGEPSVPGEATIVEPEKGLEVFPLVNLPQAALMKVAGTRWEKRWKSQRNVAWSCFTNRRDIDIGSAYLEESLVSPELEGDGKPHVPRALAGIEQAHEELHLRRHKPPAPHDDRPLIQDQ